MDKINNSKLRIGNFTSSEIVCLMSEPTATAKKAGAIFGQKALTYIAQCNRERRHGLSLDVDTSAPPLNWGKCCEPIAHAAIPDSSYSYKSDVTIQHPDYDWWCGSPDGFRHDVDPALKAVIDYKCPMSRDSFSKLVDVLYDDTITEEERCWSCILDIRENHTDGDKYYWQLVSNAIISNVDYAELIIYMPYERELASIQKHAKELFDDGEKQYYFIANAEHSQLPFIREKFFYENVNAIHFKVPQIDKDLLTYRAVEASKLLIPRK